MIPGHLLADAPHLDTSITANPWTMADVSNLIGAISLAFWLCNGIPLVYEIYKRKSADGVSLGFVGLWAIGDVLNLAGSLWAHLVPTTIVVAVYYIFSDAVIIGEALYFNAVSKTKDETVYEEETPLLDSSANSSPAEDTSLLHEVLYNALACLGVTALGCFGWYVSDLMLKNRETPHLPIDSSRPMAVGPQVLGYSSAMLYLCARIPQIMKNFKKKKTDGLALLFFIFSVFGNLTYAASIIAFSSDMEYLITNIPWLMGSLGTLVFDFIILFQFLIYRSQPPEHETERSIINT